MSTVISVECLCKTYQLGAIGGATLRADVSRWLANLRGKPDPNLQIGQEHQARLRGQEFKALRDVSFEVQQGEILGIIGRNGAGKSTLLKVLSRVTAPTSGAVKIKGRIASLLEVGTGFHPELTGRENIFLNGAILGMSKTEIRKKFDEIVDFSGVEQFIDTPVKRYSSGMYVRLAFAVAAHLEPEILIVDEVLAVGDAEFQKKCLGKMQDVSKGGRTVLFVSHQISAVTRLCKSALWMDAGKTREFGPADLICTHYLANESEVASRREWDLKVQAPGNEWVKLVSVEAEADGKPADSVDIKSAVNIHLTYRVLQDGKVLIPNIHFFADDGTLIFISHDWYSGWRAKPKTAGQYRTTFTVPGNFFSGGRINTKVAITTYSPYQIHFEEPDVVAFTIIDNAEGETSRGDYAGHLPGIVRPLIASKTEVIR
jgi:lipopolysaccharide transport system ATP-binding protein